MQHLPIFLDLRGRRAVVLGGGAEAARKIELLLRAGARPLVITEADPCAATGRWIAGGCCEHRVGPFQPDWLANAAVAFAVTGDPDLDARFASAAGARSVPVNVVDRPELCSFIMPAIVDRAPITVAVSTGGASPTLTQLVRDRIERLLPAGLGELARLAALLRPIVQKCVPDQRRRRRLWHRTLSGKVEALAFRG